MTVWHGRPDFRSHSGFPLRASQKRLLKSLYVYSLWARVSQDSWFRQTHVYSVPPCLWKSEKSTDQAIGWGTEERGETRWGITLAIRLWLFRQGGKKAQTHDQRGKPKGVYNPFLLPAFSESFGGADKPLGLSETTTSQCLKTFARMRKGS